MAAKKKSKATKKKKGEDKPEPQEVINKLRRAEDDRVLAGVAGGLGKYFNIDSTVIRLIFVMLTVFGGGGVLLYLVLWLIMPSESSLSTTPEDAIEENKQEIREKAQQAAENIKYHSKEENENNKRETFAILLLILGVYFLLDNLGYFRYIDLSRFWPLILIFLGLGILMKKV